MPFCADKVWCWSYSPGGAIKFGSTELEEEAGFGFLRGTAVRQRQCPSPQGILHRWHRVDLGPAKDRCALAPPSIRCGEEVINIMVAVVTRLDCVMMRARRPIEERRLGRHSWRSAQAGRSLDCGTHLAAVVVACAAGTVSHWPPACSAVERALRCHSAAVVATLRVLAGGGGRLGSWSLRVLGRPRGRWEEPCVRSAGGNWLDAGSEWPVWSWGSACSPAAAHASSVRRSWTVGAQRSGRPAAQPQGLARAAPASPRFPLGERRLARTPHRPSFEALGLPRVSVCSRCRYTRGRAFCT